MDYKLYGQGVKTIKYYYTDKQYKELLANLVIFVDTREQKNQHILDWFDANEVAYTSKALKTGDYSFMVKANPDLGFLRDTYFTNDLIIERKNSVEELAGNLSDKSDRIFKEFSRMQSIERCHILIENSSIDDVIEGNYRSNYNADSYLRTLLTLQKRCNFYLTFIEPEHTGKMIYEICKNTLDSKILK